MIKKLKQFFLILSFLLPFFLAGCNNDENIKYDQKDFNIASENCWPCVMYMYTFKSLDNTLNGALEKVAQNSLIILEICLLFWLLFKVGNIVFSIAMPDMKKQLPQILIVLFKALITIIFLTNTQFFYDFFGKMLIQPLGSAFLSLSEQMLISPTEITGEKYELFSKYKDELIEVNKVWNNIVSSGKKTGGGSMFGEIPARVIQVVYAIYASLNAGLGLAYQLFNEDSWSAFVSAILLIICLWWLILMVPLFLVEAFIKMGIVLLLLPLFMVGWVFTFPKDIVKKVVHSLFSGFFDILFNCIYIAFFITMLRIYTNKNLSGILSPDSAATTTTGTFRVQAEQMGTNFLILLALSIVMIALSNHVQEFSNHFFEGSEKSNVLEVMKAMKDYAVKALKYAVMAITNAGGLAAQAAVDGTKKLAQKSKGDEGQ